MYFQGIQRGLLFFLITFVCLAVTGLTGDALATTITVTNTADSGAGTLRNALASAANGDTINFSLTTPATITLTTGELVVSNNVTILGPGPANLAVNGNFPNTTNRVFFVNSGITVTMANLTITNGATGTAPGVPSLGGGIYNDHATLTVSNCTISGNSATGGGGGVYNDGNLGSATLTVIASTLSGNSSGNFGGGIFNASVDGSATVAVMTSTLRGNAAAGGGGAIYNEAHTGNATLTVMTSTLSSNSSTFGTGGILNDSGELSGVATVTISASTLSDNSGSGLENIGSITATIEIGNTILKAGPFSQSIANNAGTVTSLGYNLSSDDGGGYLTAMGDQINIDPILGPLQNNGGPTFTHALLCGSPAIDQGTNITASATDQRGAGFLRVVDLPHIANAAGGDGTDIGAVEVQVQSSLPISVLNTNDSGIGSLRQAILDANADPCPDIINLDPGSHGVITLTSGELLITASLVINGPGPANLAVNGNFPNTTNRVFRVTTNAAVTISSLTITNGGGVLSGGGIYNDHAILTVSNCTISGNSATGTGGGIANDGASGTATLTVISSTFSGNSAGDGGGAILNGGIDGSVTLTLMTSTLRGNSAGNVGGGIYNYGVAGNATLTVMTSTLSSNSTPFGSGGIHNIGDFSGVATVAISASTLSDNGRYGIQIEGGGGTATIEIGNTILKATSPGQNIFNLGGTVTSHGHNLCSDSGGSFLNATGDQNFTDPKLGPLQANGGRTFTHALMAGSPAIDQGKRDAIPALALDTDQRGEPRPFDDPNITNADGGDGSDIGAFEAQLVDPPGDVNGDVHVTGADSLLINQVLVGLRSNTHPIFALAGFANGDVNTNNAVNGADSLLINQVLVGLRSYVTTEILPGSHSSNQVTAVTIFGIGFPTNVTPTITIGAPVNRTLTNVVVVNREKITATVPAGGGLGTGTVNVISSPTNGVISFGRFINE